MLSLAEHQKYLRVMDIKETDLFKVDRVFQKHKSFFRKIVLAHDPDDVSDLYKQTKSLGSTLN